MVCKSRIPPVSSARAHNPHSFSPSLISYNSTLKRFRVPAHSKLPGFGTGRLALYLRIREASCVVFHPFGTLA